MIVFHVSSQLCQLYYAFSTLMHYGYYTLANLFDWYKNPAFSLIFSAASCYLKLATCNLLLATCYLQLATCNLQLATCNLQLHL